METNTIAIMQNNYVRFVKNKEMACFEIHDLVKEKIIFTTSDYSDGMKMFFEKTDEYSDAAIGDTCTMKGISLDDLLKGLEVLPKDTLVDFSIRYDAGHNKLVVCD